MKSLLPWLGIEPGFPDCLSDGILQLDHFQKIDIYPNYCFDLCTSIKYIFNSFLISERLLHKKLLNINLIEVPERDKCSKNNYEYREQNFHNKIGIVDNGGYK